MTKSKARSASKKLNLAAVDDYSLGDHSPQQIVRHLRQAEKAHFGEYLAEPSKEALAVLAVWQSEEIGNDQIDWRAEYDRQAKIPTLYDAELHGTPHDGLPDFYQKSMTFMVGVLYGQGDKRNTRDGCWKPKTLTVLQWFDLFSKHPVGKCKEGAAFVPGIGLGGKRTDTAITSIHALVIDVDGGSEITQFLAALIAAGVFGLIHTSFRHGLTELDLKHDDIVKKLKLQDSPTTDEVKNYLRGGFAKDQYDDDFIDQVEVIEPRRATKDGARTIVKIPAMEKCRAIIPLAKPIELTELGTTLDEQKRGYADILTGFFVNTLGLIHFDTSSCNINQVYFTPRHPEGAEFYSAIIEGEPVDAGGITPYSKDKYLKERNAAGDPFMAGEEGGVHKVPRVDTPTGVNLNDWHRKAKERFLIADVIETFAADKIRTAGGERAGTVHLECPFEFEHSSTGGTATMAMNPEANKDDVWTVFCKHDACQGRHKLEFLQQMLSDQWFDEKLLIEDGFLIPLADDDHEDDVQSVGKYETTEDWLPKGYVVGTDMIFFQETNGDETANIPVCGVLEVVGRTADSNGTEGAGRIISFKNENGIRAELTLDRASLYANGPDVVRKMADAGLPMEAGTQQSNDRLLNLLRRMTPKRLVGDTSNPRQLWQACSTVQRLGRLWRT